MLRVIEIASSIAVSRDWAAEYDENDDLRIEVPTDGQRSQVVNILEGQDRDGDAVAWIWSTIADVSATPDPWALLQLNAEITYGRIAVRGDDVVLAHTLYDAMADEDEVGKAIFWVARMADELEEQCYGSGVDDM